MDRSEFRPQQATTPRIGEELAPLAVERMGFAANAVPALIAYLDTSVRYAWVNDAYSRWFGRPREEILGRHPSELLDAADWTAVKPYTERALAGEEVAFDNTEVLEGGVTRDARVVCVPDRDDNGRIGLTLVKTLVGLHGGSVRAASEGLGRGSQLVVRLPLAPPAERRPFPAAAVPRTGEVAPLRVLVVDNVDAANAVGHLLKRAGH